MKLVSAFITTKMKLCAVACVFGELLRSKEIMKSYEMLCHVVQCLYYLKLSVAKQLKKEWLDPSRKTGIVVVTRATR